MARYHRPPMKSRWSLLALCAFFVAAAVAVAGCGSSGSSVPSGAVANVAGNPISTRSDDHFMYIVDKSQAAESEGEAVIVPTDPPQFTGCIAQARADVPSVKKETDTQLRAACKSLFTSLNGEAMDYLITSYWYQAEAHKLGITVTGAQAQAELTKERQADYKTKAAYQAYLTESGETNADLLYQTRLSLIEKKLLARHSTKVTSADVASYYAAHKSTYGTPQSRNLRIVLAKSASTAKTALAALKKGESWGTVAKKYSIDPTTKNKGGLLTDVQKGQQDAALSKAAFAAPLNKLVGPVKGSFGYYVVQVIKITPGNQESLAKATKSIKSTLASKNSTAAQTALTAAVKNAYGSRTICSSTYSVSLCHGYKAPKTASASASATTPASGSTGTTPAATGSATGTTTSGG